MKKELIDMKTRYDRFFKRVQEEIGKIKADFIFSKSAKNNPHVFETKPRKFGNAKLSHYTISSVENKMKKELIDMKTEYFGVVEKLRKCNRQFAQWKYT